MALRLALRAALCFTARPPVRLGGPVAPAAGWLVYRRGSNPLPGEMAVGPEIGVTGELAAFAALVRGEGPAEFKLLLGCAGWAPG